MLLRLAYRILPHVWARVRSDHVPGLYILIAESRFKRAKSKLMLNYSTFAGLFDCSVSGILVAWKI